MERKTSVWDPRKKQESGKARLAPHKCACARAGRRRKEGGRKVIKKGRKSGCNTSLRSTKVAIVEYSLVSPQDPMD